jgi:hypothetical protein
MVYHAESQLLRNQKAGEQKDKLLDEACDEYREHKASEGKDGVRVFADKFGVDTMALLRRYNGGQTIREFNATKQKLKRPKEAALTDVILRAAERGFPMMNTQIMSYANALLKEENKDYEPVGEKWVQDFLRRQHVKLSTHWSKPLDTQRARALNPTVVNHWYELVDKTFTEHDIQPENVYGMDESGFPPGNQGKQRVVGARGTKTQHKQGGADRENVTAFVTICADGTMEDPAVLFKGQRVMHSWTENNVAKCTYIASIPITLNTCLTIPLGLEHRRKDGQMGRLLWNGFRKHLSRQRE